MENRENIVADYFKLRVLLNKTNLKRDQKTELEFYIERRNSNELYFFSRLKHLRNSNGIELCHKHEKYRWSESGFSGLSHLENFCAKFLAKHLSYQTNVFALKKAIVHLETELRSLGIPR